MEKVLIVEDEARIRNIIFDYFSAHGLICDIARNGEEALDILRDNDYDAILLDILMPELDGFGVCKAVRRNSNVPILFLTALGGEEDTLKGYALGCDDYMAKPFSLAVLLQKHKHLFVAEMLVIRSDCSHVALSLSILIVAYVWFYKRK